eukprot:Lankesteria_metandrocarpae@DN2406_c0_g1_i1.p1
MEVGYISQKSEALGGFDFSNVARNDFIAKQFAKSPTAMALPPVRKTGTTICGVKCGNCVVLGADTRATEGYIVADKNCQKLHPMSGNIWCAGAGTAADLEHTTGLVASKMELHRLVTSRQPRVATAVAMLSQMLFKYQGHIGCALVVGGYDHSGPKLYKVHSHGSSDMTPFAAMGSGSLCAEGVLEGGYKDNMSLEEGVQLVTAAIRSGILNDLGSGSFVDVVVIEAHNKCTLHRNLEKPVAALKYAPQQRKFPSGTTQVLLEKIQYIKKNVVEDVDADGDVQMRAS